MEPLLITKIMLILPSAITNKTITSSTKLEHLNRSSKGIQVKNQGLMINQIKFFYYHKVNQINIRRSLLTTLPKNQCVINARECLKHIEDCNNINDHATEIKSLNET